MQITGKVIHKSEIQTGTSKNGNEWQKLQIVIKTQEQYSKTVALDFFGKVVDYAKNINENNIITAEFDVESREYNGRWYTNVKAWKIETNSIHPTIENDFNPPLPDIPSDNLPF